MPSDADETPFHSTAQGPLRSLLKVAFVARPHYRLIAIVTAVVIVFDQIVKWTMTGWLGPRAVEHRWELVGRILALEYVENTGAAFGILAGRAWLVSILAIVVAALFVVLVASRLDANPLNQVAVGMILGGAAGNMIDRVRFGYVIDYIAVGTWPRFNVADSAVTLGVALVMVRMVRDDQHDARPIQSPPEPNGVSPTRLYKDHDKGNDGAR